MAGLGGAFLSGDYVLQKILLATLLSALMWVFAFVLVMVLFLRNPFYVGLGTATYAAVLVGFLSTSV
jgi:hypothetical protein